MRIQRERCANKQGPEGEGGAANTERERERERERGEREREREREREQIFERQNCILQHQCRSTNRDRSIHQ